MRHKKLNKRLGRNKNARSALIRDLAIATLKYESITTTKVKAKEARKLVERLISLAKEGSLSSRRLAYKELCNHNLVSLLFKDVASRFQKRNGGYTRIFSLLDRRGDGAEQVILELTERKAEKPPKAKTEKEGSKKEKKPTSTGSEPSIKEEAVSEKEITPAEVVASESKKSQEETNAQEKPRTEEKSAPPLKEKQKQKKTQPPQKFFGGLRKLFKKEKDSL